MTVRRFNSNGIFTLVINSQSQGLGACVRTQSRYLIAIPHSYQLVKRNSASNFLSTQYASHVWMPVYSRFY